MRRFFAFLALLVLVAAPVCAQPAPDTRPPALSPLDDSIEPQVTIKKRDGATVEEYRVNGNLFKIRVTPEHGVPYTLVDTKGDGVFVRVDGPGTPQISVPMWVIGTF
jgi:hypothetical protein